MDRAPDSTLPAHDDAPWPEIQAQPEGDPLPLLPDGAILDIGIIRAKTRSMFKGETCVELTCQVLTGPHEGLEMPCYLRLPGGKTRLIPRGSKFYRMWTLANGGQRPGRRDRMGLAIFKGRMFRARTRVVKTTASGPALLPSQWYSIVDELIP
jgi:hypothetical protein